jgi:hypothetical protein
VEPNETTYGVRVVDQRDPNLPRGVCVFVHMCRCSHLGQRMSLAEVEPDERNERNKHRACVRRAAYDQAPPCTRNAMTFR